MSLELKLPPSQVHPDVLKHGFFGYIKNNHSHRVADSYGVEFNFDAVNRAHLSSRKRKKNHKGFKGMSSLIG